MGKVFKKITKPIQKLIPKEIKPFLPALAAVFGPAAFASMGGGIGAAFAKLPAFAQAAIVRINAAGLKAALGEMILNKQRHLELWHQAGSVIGKGFRNSRKQIFLMEKAVLIFDKQVCTRVQQVR
jgi:hypothetical protein